MDAGLRTVAERKPWQFAPGVSGNAGGRPAKTEPEREAERLAKVKAPWAIKKLVTMAENRSGAYSDTVELAATNALLDRALGKPAVRADALPAGGLTILVQAAPEYNQPIPGVLRSPCAAHVALPRQVTTVDEATP